MTKKKKRETGKSDASSPQLTWLVFNDDENELTVMTAVVVLMLN